MVEQDQQFMKQALQLAERAASEGEVPVGAVVVCGGKVIGEGWNQSVQKHDPSAHAEIMALRAAAQEFKNYRLINCDLYVTLEPCMMCAGAIVHSRVKRLVYGAADPKTGVINTVDHLFERSYLNHRVEVAADVLAVECSHLLKGFFKQRRAMRKQ